jgi:type II secretory pathway pseudopilin PulG
MMRRLRIHNARADTIVEVLIVLAVLGLAFSISYATANHAVIRARNAQEHSEALGILKSQVDLTRAAVSKGVDPPTLTQSFCIPDPANPQTVQQFSTVPADATTDDNANYPNYPAGCVSTFYHASGTYDSTSSTVDFRVRWTGIGTLGAQQEEISYRIYKITPGPSGIPLGSGPPQIIVKVRALQPNADNTTPACNSGNPLLDHSGTTVILNQTDGLYVLSQTTDSSSSAIFLNLIDGGHYLATMTGYPSGFLPCPPTSQGPVQIAPGSTTVLNMTIQPQCVWTTFDEGYYSDYLGYYSDYLGYYSDYLGYYSDYLGYYGDPYTVYWYAHTGPDGRRNGWPTYTFFDGPGNVNEHVFRGDLGYDSRGWFYEWWTQTSGIAYTAPYDHWSAPYNHYSAPYNHYSAPYDHWSAPYEHYISYWVCPP